MHFSITDWQARAAAMQLSQSWQDWALRPFCPAGDKPFEGCADFLPAMQRRRLSDLARGVVGCIWPLMEKSDNNRPLPLVFVSRHGETSRSFELLKTVAEGQPLSPTAFCLSVHNAIAGQWSLAFGETAEMVALSAEGDGFEHGFVEAVLLLKSGHSHVLLVAAEEPPPEAYQPWISDVPFAYVTAFLLKNGADFGLSPQASTERIASRQWPNSLNFLRHLLRKTPSWQHGGIDGARCWQWTRRR